MAEPTDEQVATLRAWVDRRSAQEAAVPEIDPARTEALRAVLDERDALRADIAQGTSDYLALSDRCDRERVRADSLDATIAAVRFALDRASVPDREPYPDEAVDDHERSLRSGGRVVPADERVRRLARERDAMRAEVERLRRVAEAADEREGK